MEACCLCEEEKASLTEAMSIEEGDLILFGAGDWQTVCEVLGRIRLECSQYLELTKDNDSLNFLWVTEFPLLAIDNETGKWNAVHHPFTRPKAEDQHLLDDESKFGDIRAEAYDVVLNGNEIGGGSIRIHESSLQSKMFSALGINEDQAKQEFGHLLDAFSFGAPPHGGVALGFDRLVMLIAGEESIREVIAFPKNNRGIDLMSSSPSSVDFKQLREIYIKSTKEDDDKE